MNEKQRVALTSLAAAAFITAMKLIVGLETNSLGILSEAAHSGLDFIATCITFLAVTVAGKPPDKDHQYGHGKIENVSAFVETLLLFVTCGWIIWEAVDRLSGGGVHIEVNVWAFLVISVAIAIDLTRSRSLTRAARKHRSQALEADALHFSSDVWSSLVVLGGLVFVSFGYAWVDAVAAIIVAILVLFVSYRLGRRTIDALMDRVPEGISEAIRTAMEQVEGVEEVRSIRLRASGAQLFVDAVVGIKRTIPFQRAHAVMDQVEQTIQHLHPYADVVVHAEPCESGDETIADKVRMIALERGLRAPHNLEVHESQGKYHIEFDIEYLKGKSFVEAHDLTTDIEREIRGAVLGVDRVTVHMEEYEHNETHQRDVTEEEVQLRDEIRELVLTDLRVLQCNEISLLRAGTRYNLSLHCGFDRSLTLDQVHDIICSIESTLYRRFTLLRRVVVHAEPA
jgi:cation diffusion facilitator family transporter